MGAFDLYIVTPDGEAFSDRVQMITVRTTEGDLGIMKGHIDYLASVDVGRVRIKLEDGSEKTASCGGGFITCEGGVVRFVATTFEFEEDIDLERAKAAKKRAERMLEESRDDRNVAIAKLKLARALNRISVKDHNS